MYVDIVFWVRHLFTQEYSFIYPKNRKLSEEINIKICIIRKCKKSIATKLQVNFL